MIIHFKILIDFLIYIHDRINLRIFSNYLQTIIKNTFCERTKYIYLESARRDLQNDKIYQMSRFAKFLRI